MKNYIKKIRDFLNKSRLSKLIGTSVFFSGSTVFTFTIRLIAGYFITKLTDPTTLGAFNSQGLLNSYAIVLILGIQDGLARELPFHIGKGDEAKAKWYAAIAQYWVLLTGILVAILLLSLSIYNFFIGNNKLGVGWITFSINAFAAFYGLNYLLVLYRTRGDFIKLAIIELVCNFISLISVLFINLLGFFGLCLRLIIFDLLRLIFLFKWKPISVKPIFNVNGFQELLRLGTPIYLTSQLYVWWNVSNLSLILYLCGTRSVGLYQIAILTSSATELLIGSITQVIYPRIVERYGRDNSLEHSTKILTTTSIILLLVTSIISLMSWIFIPPIVNSLLPNYFPGVQAARLAIVATIPLSFQPLAKIFVIIKRQRLYAISLLTGLSAYLICILNRVNSLELQTFPIALLIGRIIYVTTMVISIFILIKREKHD